MSQAPGSSLLEKQNAAPNVLTAVPIVVLHAHNRCNCRCVMCDIWKITESRPLRPVDIEPHLVAFRRLGVKWIVFTGGEPLMNPQLPTLAQMLRTEGIALTLLTTGLLLEKCAADVANSFDEVIVSLDGPPEVHDRIRRVNGAFAMLQSGIENLRRLASSVKISARTTVQGANIRFLRKTIEAARALHLNSISFLAVDLTSHAFNRELIWPTTKQMEVGVSRDELSALESEIESLISDCQDDINSGFIVETAEKLRRIVLHFRAHLGLAEPESPPCNAPWVSAVIETDGTVRPCFFHPPIGNINDSDFTHVVNSEPARRFRSALDVASNPICKRCVCSLNYQG